MAQTIQLVKNDMEGNSNCLLKLFGFSKEEDVPVNYFEIVVFGKSTGSVSIGTGKYKSALLLLYLAYLTFKNYDCVSAGFNMNPRYRQIVMAYFGDDLCSDAINNYKTRHTTIRDLLANGEVNVYINCK